jgi:hypothetical protein
LYLIFLENDPKLGIVVLRLKALNANTLVASVFMADGNCLDFLQSAPHTNNKSQADAANSSLRVKKNLYDDDLTEITYNNQPNSQNNSMEKRNKKRNSGRSGAAIDDAGLSSTSSTLNISSLSENQILRSGELFSSTLNLEPAAQTSHAQMNKILKKIDEEMTVEPKQGTDDAASSSSHTTTVDPAEFYNLNQSQQLPPVRTARSVSPNKLQSSGNLVQTLLPTLPFTDQVLPPQPPPTFAVNNNNLTDVQSLIRNELKRVVQIQHDTVMSFLNNGQPLQQQQQPMYQLPYMQQQQQQILPIYNLDQQLMSVLRQQRLQTTAPNGMPVEFVIETKIKTINASDPAGQDTAAVDNQFMRTFEIPIQRSLGESSSSSRFINIPLLNMNTQQGDRASHLNQHQQQQQSKTESSSKHHHRDSSKKTTHHHHHHTSKITHVSKHQKHEQQHKHSDETHARRHGHHLDGVRLLSFKSNLSRHAGGRFAPGSNLLHLNDELNSSRTEGVAGSSTTRVLNKYVKQFMESTSKRSATTSPHHKPVQLLRLGSAVEEQDVYEEDKSARKMRSGSRLEGRLSARSATGMYEDKGQEKTPTPTFLPMKTPTPPPTSQTPIAAPTDSARPQSVLVSNNEPDNKVADKPVQVAKPLYDGFILAPGLFEELLRMNVENEQVSASSALAHFKATQHIRDALASGNGVGSDNVIKPKRDTFTMTDSSTVNGAYPIPPNILLKLKFDDAAPRRDDSDENAAKDFVNVADLDSNDVDDILKLIEHEQNKRVVVKQQSKTVIDRREQRQHAASTEPGDTENRNLSRISENADDDLNQSNKSSSPRRRGDRSILVNEDSKLQGYEFIFYFFFISVMDIM